jgi:hypothetical protein
MRKSLTNINRDITQALTSYAEYASNFQLVSEELFLDTPPLVPLSLEHGASLHWNTDTIFCFVAEKLESAISGSSPSAKAS